MKDNLICFAITISVTTIIMCIAGIICLNIQLQSMWDELGLEIKQFNIKVLNIQISPLFFIFTNLDR